MTALIEKKYENLNEFVGVFFLSSTKGNGVKRFKQVLVEVAKRSELLGRKPKSFMMLEEWILSSRVSNVRYNFYLLV